MHNMKQLEAEFRTALTPGVLKAAMKEAGASSGDLWKVPVPQLRVIDGFNVRVKNAKYKAQVRRLADSIKSEGFYLGIPDERDQ